MRAQFLLTSALVATVFATACEWTSSDGITWDESYNNVNFSGTYPIGAIVAATEAENSTQTVSATQTISGGSGQLKGSGILSATVTAYAKDGGSSSGRADAPGPITFDNPNYSGSIGESGAISVSGRGFAIDKLVVSYTYSYAVPTTGGTVTSITVHQTGQNVTMTLDNGTSFSGQISGFDTTGDSVQTSPEVIAKFNVSGAQGSIAGTLTSTFSNRLIDGVLKLGKGSTSFSGSIGGSGRASGSSSSSSAE